MISGEDLFVTQLFVHLTDLEAAEEGEEDGSGDDDDEDEDDDDDDDSDEDSR